MPGWREQDVAETEKRRGWTRTLHPVSQTIRLAGGFATLAGLFLCAGCGESEVSKNDTSAEQPFAGAKLTIAVPPGSKLAVRWQSLLIEWSARTGAEATVKEVPLDELLPEKSGGVGGDLVVFPLAALPDFAAADALAPIPRALQESDSGIQWSDAPRGLATNVVSVNRNPVVLPISCPVLVLYYRKDLLAKAGQFPPETWEDYQKLLETTDRWAPGLTAAEPWSEDFRATMFLARSLAYARHPENFSLLFDIETGEPLLHSAPWIRGLETARKAVERLPQETLTWSPADCRRRILEGKAALAIGYDVPSTSDDSATPGSTARDLVSRGAGVSIGVVRLPGSRTTYNRSSQKWDAATGGVNRASLTAFAGLAAGVSSKSDDLASQAAWNLLATLSDPAVFSTAFTGPQRSLSRMTQAEQGRMWFGAELTDGEGAEFLQATAESLHDMRLTPELPVVRNQEFCAILGEGLGPALKGEAEASETLEAIDTKWRALVEKIGPATVRDSCRRQLGLSARQESRIAP